jgi:hypothetical protein
MIWESTVCHKIRKYKERHNVFSAVCLCRTGFERLSTKFDVRSLSRGSAVAHANVVSTIRHSCGRPRISTSCVSKTVKPIYTKFCVIDYVAEISKCANFGCNRLYGGAPAYAWNITFAYLLFFFFKFIVSQTHAQPERNTIERRIMAQTMWICARICLLGVSSSWRLPRWVIPP